MAETPFITRQVALIRRLTDEPSFDAKYTETELLEHIEAAYEIVLADLNTASDAPLTVRHSLSIAAGTNLYLLPPGIDMITRLAKLNSDTGLADWVIEPGSPWSWQGPGVRLEGRALRFEPYWTGNSATLEVKYIPNGDFRLLSGPVTATSSTVTLPATPTNGTLDTRENAYVGAIVRITGATPQYVQERVITAYDRTTRIATVDIAFSPTPGGTLTAEVVPAYGRLVEMVVGLYVAIQLLSVAGNAKRVGLLETQYLKARRALRLRLNRMQSIVSDRFEQDTDSSGSSVFGTLWA